MILDDFRYLIELLKWHSLNVMMLLSRESLSYEEWENLYRKTHAIFEGELSKVQSVEALFAKVVEKGIVSLGKQLERKKITRVECGENEEWQWYCYISGCFKSNGPVNPYSGHCSIDENRRLLALFLPVVQMMKNPIALDDLAGKRFPGDEEAIDEFVKRHTNW